VAAAPNGPPVAVALDKLTVPRLPVGVVRRPRLFERLDAGVRGPVTLVVGPAGTGKTVLLASWVAAGRPPGPVAWLTLDPADVDPDRFWASVLAALRQVGGTTSSVLHTLQPRLQGADGDLPQLLFGALARLPEPVVLVLDDFHTVGVSEVVRAAEAQVRRTPPQLRVVIATRADPTLPLLPQLRLTGELVELRGADLAFTAAEAAELLEGHGVLLSDQDLARLRRRTEGWAAGLRLAALWLQGQPDPNRDVAAFAGTDRTVADYLVAEVLNRQPPELRQFLLSTSVVDQVSGELANALTGRQDGDQMLALLERANAFIVAVDPDRRWYRYHPLFAELLRFELRRRSPEELAGLHRRAAGWHAEHGAAAEAVRHALDAGDWADGVALLVRSGLGLALRGEVSAIRRLAERLPPEIVRDTPEVGVLLAFDRFERLDHRAAERYLELVRRQQSVMPEGRRERLTVLVGLLELTAARRSGRLERVLEVAQELLALQVTAGAPIIGVAEDEAVRSAALLDLGAAELWLGRLEDAERHLRDGATGAERTGLGLLRLEGLGHLAHVQLARGRLHAADRTARMAADLAERQGWAERYHAGGAHLALASVSLEWNDLDAASRHMEPALRTTAATPWRPAMLGTAIVHARLCQARGDPAAAHAVLDTARQELAGWSPPPPAWLRDWATITEAELDTVSGDGASARTLLERLGEDGAAGDPAFGPKLVALARLRLADGDAAGAVQTLEPLQDRLAAAGSPRPLIAAWLLQALATRALGEQEQSSRSLERALALAQPEGFRRVFADGGAQVRALLASHLESATWHRSFLGELLGQPAGAVPPEELVEPLSDRERVVLRYLPSRLAAAEIAAELYLSVHTVKSHLRNLYRKLQASNRREAVDRARELQLL
jgi:LuxR family transcriptional regulator, maltose regulon positive regulatory protein